MGYLFLTGATGLLGSYLIRDLLRSGVKLAVLARSSRMAGARDRIETQMVRWEKQAGRPLPRPVVFEGDINRPHLGLDQQSRDWVSENVTSFMHNAASLVFQAESPTSEPYVSNVMGTKNVLAFCEAANIREFFHVSTAYIAGLRNGLVLESELDVGQEHGNDYEISKSRSEQMVRSAPFIDRLTVFRPGIILGDSKDGYTATFHGFYVPLKLISTSIQQTASLANSPEELVEVFRLSGEKMRGILSLDGSEGKYFVPVDWVSAAMVGVFTNPAHHEKTYHLTPREPVPISLVQQVLEENSVRYADLSKEVNEELDWGSLEQTFYEGMQVYQSYWRNDPQYDHKNIAAALPHLPCPEVDAKMLHVMCRYAMDSNFGWPVEPIIKPEFDVDQHLRDCETELLQQSDKTDDSNNRQEPVSLGLRVTGRGGGEWELQLEQGQLVAVHPGISSRCTATYFLNSKTFQQMTEQRDIVETGIATGRILIEGNGVPLEEMTDILRNLTRNKERNT